MIGGIIIIEVVPILSFIMGILVSSLSETTTVTTGISMLFIIIGILGYIRILTSES